ncbi:aminoglycoside 6-adenylyltransferase [Vibrio salinus]|uniref:aminoglycoside 6-adenylyltransferase n=1 Tax=Vibrio salinus TaxID=2899784 RepID=UPI003562A2AC
MNSEYTGLLNKIKNYVVNCKKINALALIGSHSKNDNLSDEYSDLDLIIITKHVDDFF